MKDKIFRGIFYVAIIVWVSSLLLILGVMYPSYTSQLEKDLKTEVEILGSGIEFAGLEYLNKIELNRSIADTKRITLVNSEGIVIFDSKYDIEKLDNHSQREEIKEAREDGFAMDVRYSDTMSKKNIYVAKKLEDNSIIRIGSTQITILALVLSTIQPILFILVVAMVLSLILANRISVHIVKPINEIDVEHPSLNNVYGELRPLVNKISDKNQEKQAKIDELEVNVVEKTKESEYRKEFTANVSHELKTPLTSISGFAEIIKNGIVKEEDIPRFAGKIYDEAQRLITLVGDIIKLSQLDENAVLAKKEKIDLYNTCENIIDHLRDSSEKRNIDFTLDGEPTEIMAVEPILEEIIYNLCDNSIKYNVDGGKVYVKVGTDDGRAFISVRDTGIGIDTEDLERVCERFYRVNKSHSKEVGGTGLGLSIVKHGVAYHNATIAIESEVDVGTNIIIKFN